MSKPSEHEVARIKKAGKTMAQTIKRTAPEHRSLLFSSMAKQFDIIGEDSMTQLFAGIAGTYLRRSQAIEKKRQQEEESGDES